MVSRRTVLWSATAATAGLLTACGAGPERAPSPETTSPAPSPARGSTASSRPSPTPTPSPTVASPTPPASTGPVEPRVTATIADDLDVPWGIAFLASGDALVSERNSGRILRITKAGKVSTVGEVAGVEAPSGQGEGGLLGIALPPGDESTLFAYITTASDNRVVKISLEGGKINKPIAVLSGIPTSTHHHGGKLLFDSEGLLYVATGDAEQSDLAQDKDSLAGKVLRIRTDGGAAPGNPFGNRTWTYGHRNIEGLAFDDQRRLWATEFGDKEADELNLLIKGSNYGWPSTEGRTGNKDFVSPKAVWSPTSSCSPAGVAITRSTAFVGALQGQCLFSVPLDGASAGKPVAHFAETYGRIRTVVVAPDGALWITTSNTDGRIDPGAQDDKILRVSL